MKQLTSVVLVTLFAFAASAGNEVIRRGAAISKDTKTVPLADVLAKPEAWTMAPVVVEGVVSTVCQNKGCWMEIAPESGKPGMRVTFLDYGFFVPKNSKGYMAILEGKVEIKKLPKDHVDHLEDEGASIERQPDGSAIETSFIAAGVELHKQ